MEWWHYANDRGIGPCEKKKCSCAEFRSVGAPADAEAAGEPECTCPTGSWGPEDGPLEPDRDCPVHGDDWGAREPEAPEHDCGNPANSDQAICAPCRARGRHHTLRRPPYAVAYAIEGGAQYEIALPGDATVRAVDGALVITHDKPVLAMGQVRPMEGA